MQPAAISLKAPEFYLLAEIPDPPAELWSLGSPTPLLRPTIAIVGGRSPSRYGIFSSFNFARGFAAQGWTVISGLALGIDTAAHLGALSAGGPTLAVLGHGLDQIYPSQNREIARQILAEGCLLSEYPAGVPPLRHHFPRRNRIISGLSWGVLVIEARVGSGSLITAHCALDQGRDIFVLPGPFHLPGFRGSHDLVQQGARLVTTVSEILEEYGGIRLAPRSPLLAEESQLREILLKTEGVATFQEICRGGSLSRVRALELIELATSRAHCYELAKNLFVWCDS